MHERINFDRFAAVEMYQVYREGREGNFVEKKKISKCWEGNYFCQSGNTAEHTHKGLFPRPLFLGEMRRKIAPNVLIHAQ